MFGFKWLTPERVALLGAAAFTGGATAPAALAGETAAASGAAGAGGLFSSISADAALAGTEASLAGSVGAGITGSLPATGTGESFFGAVPGMGGSSMWDKTLALGNQAKGYLDEANKVIKPVGSALGAAKTAQGLLSPDSPPMQAPAPHMGGGGNQVYAGLLQEQQTQAQSRMQEEMQRRQAQQKLLSMIGGR
jgi:hypothetical protein